MLLEACWDTIHLQTKYDNKSQMLLRTETAISLRKMKTWYVETNNTNDKCIFLQVIRRNKFSTVTHGDQILVAF